MVTPHVLVPKRRCGVNAGNDHKDISRESVPFIDAMAGCRVARTELWYCPDAKQIESSIRCVRYSRDNYDAKKNIERVVGDFCNSK
jgi:hypothetical protein